MDIPDIAGKVLTALFLLALVGLYAALAWVLLTR